jgi:periplasmic mercuric ion binding protein
MNTKLVLTTVIIALMSISNVFGQKSNDSFWVAGNCGMCEERIEDAAKSVKGVHSAEWNKETQMLSVSYDSDLIKISKVHSAVADAGHDTKLNKADDEAYNKLADCCKYERKKAPCKNTRKSGCCGRS